MEVVSSDEEEAFDAMAVDSDDDRPAAGSNADISQRRRDKQKRTDPSDVVGSTLPWVEKYRPSGLDDLISHEEIISTINRLIDGNRLPHLLFYGPPGTGKTSTIMATAKKLYGPHYGAMVLELNASDDRGIDVVRNQIKEFAGTKKLFSSGVKLIILDEADAMTNDAQFSLRRVIEKYTKNARFCLICNYVSKIIPALQSRCTRFRFSPLKPEQIRSRIEYITSSEKLSVTEDGYEAVLRLGKGDMRRVLNIMQAASMAYSEINEVNIYLCTGNPQPQDIRMIVDHLLNDSFDNAFKTIREMMTTRGYALTDILTGAIEIVAKMHLPMKVLGYLLDELSNLEYRLAFATADKLQLGSLVGVFTIARDMMKSPAP